MPRHDPRVLPGLAVAALAVAALALSAPGCGGGAALAPSAGTPAVPVAYFGDRITINLAALMATAPAGSQAAIRSGVNYYRHWTNAYRDYTSRTHAATRAIDLNFALSISSSVADFRSRLTHGGTRSGVMFQEALQRSDSLIVFFDSMPQWLSSCPAKLGSAAACRAATGCGYKGGVSYHHLYPPADWTAWNAIVATTVDVLLDLTQWNDEPRTVYLEAWNEPNVSDCSWHDSHANFIDYYHRTAVAFSRARAALCAAKNLPAQRCQRLKFGGPAVAGWNSSIDPTRGTTLIEDLIADSLARAGDPDHRLDFISFHGFWNPVSGPREHMARATAQIRAAFAAAPGAPLALPEIVLSEWNADDATRAGPYHPVTIAEGAFALLESGTNRAAIASLDAYSESATISSNDFGLLLPDRTASAFQRPAYFVYAALDGLAQGSAAPRYLAHDSLRIVARPAADPNCHDLLLWDFAPDPLASALHGLLVDLPTTAAELARSYVGAASSGATPAPCSAYVAAAANATAAKALCTDVYEGSCNRIPVPTPAGGHACDGAWARGFASAGARLRTLASKQAAAAAVSIADFAGTAALAKAAGTVVSEDHAQPAPKALALGLGADGSALAFTLARNTVARLSNVCVRPPAASP